MHTVMQGIFAVYWKVFYVINKSIMIKFIIHPRTLYNVKIHNNNLLFKEHCFVLIIHNEFMYTTNAFMIGKDCFVPYAILITESGSWKYRVLPMH